MARTRKSKDPQSGQSSEKNHPPQVDQSSRDGQQSPGAGAGGTAADKGDMRKPESDEDQGGAQDDEMSKDQPKRYQP